VHRAGRWRGRAGGGARGGVEMQRGGGAGNGGAKGGGIQIGGLGPVRGARGRWAKAGYANLYSRPDFLEPLGGYYFEAS